MGFLAAWGRVRIQPQIRSSNHKNIEPYNQTMPFESVRKLADADFPTRWGHFRILGFEGVVADPEPCNDHIPVPANRVESAIALVMGDIVPAKPGAEPPIVRIHSQCLTGDVFHSLRCDCRQQLELALAAIAEAGAGILLYEKQEGRGIGLMAKLQAYELQDQGMDTIEANLELGYQADCREYELPAAILKLLGVKSVRLITNNPEKVAALEAVGITVAERISAEVPPEPTFERYLQDQARQNGPPGELARAALAPNAVHAPRRGLSSYRRWCRPAAWPRTPPHSRDVLRGRSLRHRGRARPGSGLRRDRCAVPG
jgi:GTP cyclohydrolase II